MLLRRWNYKKREYGPYEVPDDWNVKTYSNDMDEIINCANCGRKIPFGYGYTSREIHTQLGMGFSVCEECMEAEWETEKKYRR